MLKEGSCQDAVPQAVWTTPKTPSSRHSYPWSRAAARTHPTGENIPTFTQLPQHELKLHGVKVKGRMDPAFAPHIPCFRGLGWIHQWKPPEAALLQLDPRHSAGVLLPFSPIQGGASSVQGTPGTEHSRVGGVPLLGMKHPGTEDPGRGHPGVEQPRGRSSPAGRPGPPPGAGRLRPWALPAARGCRAPSPGAACEQLRGLF